MATREELERLADQGDIQALLDLCDIFTGQGDLKSKIYWMKKFLNQTSVPADPAERNKYLFVMRKLGMQLALVDYDPDSSEAIEFEHSDPKKAFELYSKILNEYPDERQAMFTRCEMGQMYYNERYTKYGIPHDPDKGIALIKKWDEECTAEQGLETVPLLCYGVASTISGGRYPISRTGTDQGLNSEDLKYAKNIVKKICSDAGQIYEAAQQILEATDKYALPISRRAEIVGGWEWRTPQHGKTVWFEFHADGMYDYGSVNGARARGSYNIDENNKVTLSSSATTSYVIIENEKKLVLRTHKDDGGIDDMPFTRA